MGALLATMAPMSLRCPGLSRLALPMLVSLVACKPAGPPAATEPSRATKAPAARPCLPCAVDKAAEAKELRDFLSVLDDPPPPPLDEAQVTKLVSLSLQCIDREYPNKPGHVWAGDRDGRPPRKNHPAFFGCFDWHSAVHAHWAMVRVLARFPRHPLAPKLRAALDKHLTVKNIAIEAATFAAKHDPLFERPYGWAWYLRLVREVRVLSVTKSPHEEAAMAWATALEPLEKLLVKRAKDYFTRLSRPVRAGTHASTAFALAHLLDYARDRPALALQAALESRAKSFYLADSACPIAYEPSGEDFISPCLAEADLMRRVLGRHEFEIWIRRFFPPLASYAFRSLHVPPRINDLKDPRIGHLIGLSLHRAWCMRGIAQAISGQRVKAKILLGLADIHLTKASQQIFASGYGGAHWLASFALFALTDAGGP